jgi:hypothetical protein
VGRLLERLIGLATRCRLRRSRALGSAAGIELLLELFDSAITFRARYQRHEDLLALTDLLVLDSANPRAFAGVLRRLRTELGKLPGSADFMAARCWRGCRPKAPGSRWKTCAARDEARCARRCRSRSSLQAAVPRWPTRSGTAISRWPTADEPACQAHSVRCPRASGHVGLEVEHETRYDYAAPVSLAHHLAHLKPLHDEHQQLLDFNAARRAAPPQLLTTPTLRQRPARTTSAWPAARELRVRARSRVRLWPGSTRWMPRRRRLGGVRERLRYVAGAPYDPAVEFAQPSPFVPRLEALRAYAAPSFRPASRGRRRARPDAPHPRRLRVAAASTDVDTPLAEAFEQRAACARTSRTDDRRAAHAGPAGALCQRLPADAAAARRRRQLWAPMPRTPGCRCTAPTRRGCPTAGWTWTRPTTWCPPPATCAWRWAATTAT